MPEVHPDVPVRVFAEEQDKYKPLSVAVFHDGQVYRLVTAYRPAREELELAATTIVRLLSAYGVAADVDVARRFADELFKAQPVVVELWSQDGHLTPQNVYLGVPVWMHGA